MLIVFRKNLPNSISKTIGNPIFANLFLAIIKFASQDKNKFWGKAIGFLSYVLYLILVFPIIPYISELFLKMLIMINTNDDYSNAIKRKLEVEKLGVYGTYFTEPTPAQLRNLCLMLCENGLNGNDENVFRNFFQTKKEEDVKKSITNFEVEKFKPVIHFLKEKTNKTSAVNLELLAVLVNFEPRPLVKFLKGEKFIEKDITSTQTEEIISFVNVEKEKEVEKTKGNLSKNGFVFRILMPVVLLFFSGYVIKKEFFPKKKCMQWQIDHFEPMDCEAAKLGIGNFNDVKVLEEHLLDFKKVAVNKKTQFFRNEKPLIWYCKQNNKIDFFNGPGFHPETGKPLKPITKYMIDKWVKN